MGKIIGIDLGTTNSCVSVMEGNEPVVIPNEEGRRTTPSVVAFMDSGERKIGDPAKRQAITNPQRTIASIKRFMGRRFSESAKDISASPYKVIKGDNDTIKVDIDGRFYTAQEISAMVLQKMKKVAEDYLGQEVTEAVVTVPAYFNDSQRQATKDAGRIAGIEVKRILNEPTAASLAYGLDKKSNKKILVFDLGGGTFDVSVLEVSDGLFEVKATTGDTQLGGDDFDRQIVNYLAEEFLKSDGVDLRKERQALQRLTEAAEKAKIELSTVGVTEINLPFITATAEGPLHLETSLKRSQFERLSADLLERLQIPLDRVLRDAQISPRQIDEVVLVGGSTRIPAVQEMVERAIGKPPSQSVNPDEVVAIGAVIQAAILSGEIKDVLLLDVTPLSLGVETSGGVVKRLIPRNTTIPCRKMELFTTAEDNQTSVEIHVVQGERDLAEYNKSLGRFKLSGLDPQPRGMAQVDVTFDLNTDGILAVTASDRRTGVERRVTIRGASTLDEKEVERMVSEAEQYADRDRAKKERIEKLNRADNLAVGAERQLKDLALNYGYKLSYERRKQIEGSIKKLKDAIAKEDDALIDRAQVELQEALYALSSELYAEDEYYDDEDDDLFGGILESIGSFASRNKRGKDEDDRRRPNTRVSYDDDDDWL